MNQTRKAAWAAGMALCCLAVPAAAQDGHHRGARLVAQPTAPMPAYRGLTVTRPPVVPRDDEEIYQDGPTRYNNIRDFSPSPYVTSGVQFPYGLDGVGGYGNDLGPSGGDDTALYDRGSVNRW
ncbi:hypothetical protein P7D22_04150 [Lichenihabitans sp. Uapishka_5]|uniref:hypothetical protein n=1 Tax=Lichenihabitans sp. Uapishka_5 TaxID=3037302 RepID=UPI0029E7E3C4|nr:hypothetical protein [Lichenihabitans sp. Uapishka_5]MDX7950369.1 hypothetical protein [Lichenihabitans sp. Uapishka_5]